MHLFYLLAQTPPPGHPPPPSGGMPEWLSYILGPLGALVLLLVYAWYTEKKRIPKFQTTIDGLAGKLDAAQKAQAGLGVAHRSELAGMRTAHEARKTELTDKIEEWRDRHTKEKAVRAWYQAQAQSMAEEGGKELGVPPDIDRTHYGD